jgi:hypothetical protein
LHGRLPIESEITDRADFVSDKGNTVSLTAPQDKLVRLPFHCDGVRGALHAEEMQCHLIALIHSKLRWLKHKSPDLPGALGIGLAHHDPTTRWQGLGGKGFRGMGGIPLGTGFAIEVHRGNIKGSVANFF